MQKAMHLRKQAPDPALLRSEMLKRKMAVPSWINNADRKACQNCDASFSMTLRRHHCR